MFKSFVVIAQLFPEPIKNLMITGFLPLKRILFFGRKHYCPVCESRIRKFARYGRQKKICPVCGTITRHRIIWLFFRLKTNLFDQSPKRMLHIAPERMFERNLKRIKNLDYLTADLLDPRAMVKMDITDIQYPDNSFDIIYCSHVLEHVPDDRQAMREFRRVLKPDGWVGLVVPITSSETTFEDPSVTDPAERERLFGQFDHVRRYGLDFEDRLKEAGFDVSFFTVKEFADSNEIARQGLDSKMKIYICKK